MDSVTWLSLPQVTICRKGIWSLPKRYRADRKSLVLGRVIDELCNVLRRRIGFQRKNRFSRLFKRFPERILFVEQHPVIERLIDPGLEDLFNLGKIADHAFGVQLF